MARDAWPSGRTKILCCLAITVLAMAGCTACKLSSTLMPTPIALTLGLPQLGASISGEPFNPIQCADAELPIFVITGRNLVDPSDPIDPFGNKRSPVPTLGVAYVQVGAGLTQEELKAETLTPKKRKKAKVTYNRIELDTTPLPVDLWKVRDDSIRFQNNPWVQAIKNQMASTNSSRLTIYVHGYNTLYVDNTLIAAEIYHYMGRKGAMMSFEWPSESKLFGYIPDRTKANASTHQFRGLISNIAKECNIDTITIIGHSAGAPIVVDALREIRLLEYDLTSEQLQDKYRVGRVVLAAPDMDLRAFENAIYDGFYEMTKGVAVYASPKDRALKLSERLNGTTRLGRAVGELGDRENEIFLSVPKIEMIDASIAEQQFRNFIGHSYYQRDPWVSSDIGSFLLGRTPTERGLERTGDEPVFWQFGEDYPERLEQLLGDRSRTSSAVPTLGSQSRINASRSRAINYRRSGVGVRGRIGGRLSR